MKILITGICGFVGKTLAEGILDCIEGAEIFGIDSLVRRGSETNVEPLQKRGIKVFHGDIRAWSDLETLPQADWIIDAAANPSVLAGVDGKVSSRQLVEHNLGGTLNLLELAKRRQAGFIMLSTSRVYSIHALMTLKVQVRGDRFELTKPNVNGISARGLDESFSTEPPLSLYGSSKLSSEIMALEYGAAFDLPVYINRCGVLAGAGQFGKADQGIFSFWIHSYAQKRPLKFIGFGGEGHQVRDGLHPRDLVSLLEKQMGNTNLKLPKIFNLSGGLANSMSLRELNEWCKDRFGEHTIGSEPATRPFDIPWMILDSARAEKIWNWKPETALPDILEEIARHAEANPDWLGCCGD